MSDDGEFNAMAITLMIVLAICTTLLNSLCIIIIGKSKSLMKRPSALLLLNLLVVHWLQGTLVFPFYAAKKANVVFTHWISVICDGFRFTYMVTFYAAIMAVFLISIDRLLATCLVLRYRQIVTRKKVLITIAFAWSYVVALCVLPFLQQDSSEREVSQSLLGNNMSLTTDNSTIVKGIKKRSICSYSQSDLWTILMLTLNCAVPYVVITVIYQQILSHVNVIQTRTERSRTVITAPDDCVTPQVNHEKMCKFKDKEQKQYEAMTRIAVIMCISYFFFWLPSVVYFVTLKLCPEKCFPKGYNESMAEKYVAFFTKYLAYLDAVASPLIYCVMSGEFRKHVHCGTAGEQGTLFDKSRTQQLYSKPDHAIHQI